MTAQATESRRRWMKRITRALIPFALATVVVMVLAESGVIARLWLSVAIYAYGAGLLGLSTWFSLMKRRARPRTPN